MSERDAREILRELLHEALAGGNGNGAAPAVPPPPVAAVLRPSTWREPPRGGEVIGDGPVAAGPGQGAAGPAPAAGAEPVTIASDADLERFVRALLARFEDPREREAIRVGRVRFTLGRGGAGAGAVRVERGALTERKVAEAAKAGARLVLGPGAVVTPLAREKARALGIEIERER